MPTTRSQPDAEATRIAAEHRWAVERTREEWRSELARRGLLKEWDPAERDKVSKSIRGSLPQSIWLARELERVVRTCRRILEDDFIAGGVSIGVDPDKDPAASRTLVLNLWKVVERCGPTHLSASALRGDAWGEDGCSDAVAYGRLSPADQRRWRVAFMRFLELCARHGYARYSDVPDQWDLDHPDDRDYPDDPAGQDNFELALAMHALPFNLVEFIAVDLDEVFAAWKEKRAGAKRTGSKARSKWKLLCSAFQQVWGAENLTPKSVEADWTRYGGEPYAATKPRRRTRPTTKPA